MTLDELCAPLLPPAEPLHFDTRLFEDNHRTLMATMPAAKAVCPACCQPSQRLHSGYCRPLTALPWALRPVALRWRVRRFFCDPLCCARLPCTECVPSVAPLSARTTTRLRHRQAETGLALGGAAGARQLARPPSPSPVRRRVQRLPPPASPPPHVVGIDDWAWRQGHRDGPIGGALARGCPIDVLEDRLAETGADWCKAPPAGQAVARDRAEA
jgi:transposase